MKFKEVDPYLSVKRKYNDLAVARQNWDGFVRIVVIFCLIIAFSCVGGLTAIGMQSKIVPLVFQQDSFGNTIGMVELEDLKEAADEDFKMAAYNFITDSRKVTSDMVEEGNSVRRAYGFVSGNDSGVAKIKLTEFYTATEDSHPFKRAEKETVTVDNVSILKQTKETWQVDWIETTRNKSGSVQGYPIKMRALLQLYQGKPDPKTKKSDVLHNAHMIFIKDFNWTSTK